MIFQLVLSMVLKVGWAMQPDIIVLGQVVPTSRIVVYYVHLTAGLHMLVACLVMAIGQETALLCVLYRP